MTTAQVLRRAAGYLERHHVESPVSAAEMLLADALGTDRAGLYARTEELSRTEARRFGRALCRRCEGTPLQHITGEQGFRRLTLQVRPGVFIPRPETERLVEIALARVTLVPSPVVADIGTGTGAVGLAIKDERPDARVFASDLSSDALALARANAERLELEVGFFEGDLLDAFPSELRGAFHLIVSNPPYVTEEEYATLPPDVLADPPLALLGGIGTYERLLREAFAWLAPAGYVAVEIGESQAEEVAAVADRMGFADVEVSTDLTGRDRVVAARRP